MGYKIKVDKTNGKIIQEELDRNQEEYLKNEEIKEISEHYKTEKVSLNVAARLDIFLVHSHETRADLYLILCFEFPQIYQTTTSCFHLEQLI
jgi:hypothetical protein